MTQALHVTRDPSIACDSRLKVVWRRCLIAYLVVFAVYFAAAFVFFKYANPWHYNRISLRDYNHISLIAQQIRHLRRCGAFSWWLHPVPRCVTCDV